jgi:hypothetical protein
VPVGEAGLSLIIMTAHKVTPVSNRPGPGVVVDVMIAGVLQLQVRVFDS